MQTLQTTLNKPTASFPRMTTFQLTSQQLTSQQPNYSYLQTDVTTTFEEKSTLNNNARCHVNTQVSPKRATQQVVSVWEDQAAQ